MKTILHILQVIITVVVIVLFSMGRGAHGVFIAIFIAIPSIRCLFTKSYREELVFKFQNFRKAPTSFQAIFWLLMFPSLVLTLINGIGISSNDNYPVIMTTASILTEGDLEISEYTPASKKAGRDYCREGLQNPYYIRCTLDGVRSAYPLGMVLPMLFTFTLAKVLGQDLYDADVQWRLSKWTASLLNAISIALFFLIAKQLVSHSTAFFVSYLLIFGSTFTTIISQGPWSHGGVVLGTLFILYLELSRMQISSTFRAAFYALAIAWMFSCRLNSVGLIVPLSLFFCFRYGMGFGLKVGGFSLLFYGPLGAYYKSFYGTFWGPQMVMGATTNISVDPFWAVLGILFSPAHGLFPYQPWLLLLLFYFYRKARTSLVEKLGIGYPCALIAGIFLHIAIISNWWCWWGGTWGSRLMSEIVPLLAIFVLFPTEELFIRYKTLGKCLLSFLIVVSFFFHAPHLFFFASQWNSDPLMGDLEGEARMWDLRSPPFLYPILKRIRPMRQK